MLKEMSIIVGEEKIQILMQAGFFDLTSLPSNIHKHQYTEVHILVNGQAEFHSCGKCITLFAGDMVTIPPQKMHYGYHLEKDTRRIAFQLAKPMEQFSVFHPGKDIAALLAAEIASYVKEGRSSRLAAALSLICSDILDCSECILSPIQDRGFIINEFFSNYYNQDISLADIADILGVSEKQATRLVRKYTGNTFREEVSNRRMEAARYLMKDAEMSLEALAEHIGYKSYSGFWKAFNKKPPIS